MSAWAVTGAGQYRKTCPRRASGTGVPGLQQRSSPMEAGQPSHL